MPVSFCTDINSIIATAKTLTDFTPVNNTFIAGNFEEVLFGSLAQSDSPFSPLNYQFPANNGFDTMHKYLTDDEIADFKNLGIIKTFVLAFFQDPTLRAGAGGIYANNDYPCCGITPFPVDRTQGNVNVYIMDYALQLMVRNLSSSFFPSPVSVQSQIRGTILFQI